MRIGVIRRAFHDTIPVMTGYMVLGMGYGALWALAMGLAIYSGTMQFICIDMFTGGTGLVSCAGTALMVSARHIFYGISMSERWKNIHGLRKAYMIYALTDETYSLVCGNDDEDYCFWVSLLDHSYWVAGG